MKMTVRCISTVLLACFVSLTGSALDHCLLVPCTGKKWEGCCVWKEDVSGAACRLRRALKPFCCALIKARLCIHSGLNIPRGRSLHMPRFLSSQIMRSLSERFFSLQRIVVFHSSWSLSRVLKVKCCAKWIKIVVLALSWSSNYTSMLSLWSVIDTLWSFLFFCLYWCNIQQVV